MALFNADEISKMLSDAVEKSLGGNNKTADEKLDNAAIKGLEAKVDGIVDFIAKNLKVEKPKTTEEIVKEQISTAIDPIVKALEKLGKTDGAGGTAGAETAGSTTEEEKPLTKKDIEDLVKKAISDSVVKVEKSKGKKKMDMVDELIEEIAKGEGVNPDDLDDEEEEDEEGEEEEEEDVAEKSSQKPSKTSKVKLTTVEEVDKSSGRTLTHKERESRQTLDDVIGNVMQSQIDKLGMGKDD